MSDSRSYLTRLLVAGAALVWAGAVMADSCTNTSGNANTYCDHGNRIYDDYSGHGLAVVPKDPTCRQPVGGPG
jgi:hypothetical protein